MNMTLIVFDCESITELKNLTNPPRPPFVKGGKVIEITSKSSPFVKGDRGGFRRTKRVFNRIGHSQVLHPTRLQIAYLSAYGNKPRPPTGGWESFHRDGLYARPARLSRVSYP